MFDEMMEMVKEECERYLAETHPTQQDAFVALGPVFKAANKAMAAAGLSAGLEGHGSLVLQIFNGHMNSGPFKAEMHVYLQHNGGLMVEQYVKTQDGRQTFAARSSAIEMNELHKLGIKPVEFVKNIKASFNDTSTALAQLSSPYRN